jgi:hypothetical protein
LLFQQFHSPQLHQCVVLRLTGSHSGAQIVIDVQLQMTLDLVGQVALGSVFLKRTGEP